jgi:hypothetical protein
MENFMKAIKNFKITLFFLLALTLNHLQAEIIETPNFSCLLEYVVKNPSKNTLVILDIDDTLLVPTQTLGTDVWFGYKFSYYVKNGIPADQALEKALAEWEAIRHLTNVKTVESNTAEVVRTLQKKGISVIGLTTQGLALATRTVQHLQSLNINLDLTSPSNEDIYFINSETPKHKDVVFVDGIIVNTNDRKGVLFRHGILFTAGSNKASAFAKLIRQLGISPDKIVFINDKATHLKDAEKGAQQLEIPFIGLRYSYSDERVKNFRADIAEIQYNRSSFAHILTDEEAECYLKSSERDSPH